MNSIAITVSIFEKFEIRSCVKWILANEFKCLALQFPDNDLSYSADVLSCLQSELTSNVVEFYIIGDTNNQCCNDLINVQYCHAEALIHYGHSCLSATLPSPLPIYYVFYQQPLDNLTFPHSDKFCLVYYDPCYSEAIDKLRNEQSLERIIYSRIDVLTKEKNDNQFTLYGRSVSSLPHDLDSSLYSIFYIARDADSMSLTNFRLYFHTYEFYSYNFHSKQFDLYPSTSKQLQKRLYLIECAKQTSVYGLLVNSTSLLNQSDTIHRILSYLKQLFHRNDKTYYILLMNTMSISKMNNFSSINCYVLCSSCSENQWYQQKQFNIPLISVYDLYLAFSSDNSWNNYSLDLEHILKHLSTFEEDKEEYLSTKTNELVLKHPNHLVQMSDSNHQPYQRTWWGLELTTSKTSVDENDQKSVAELKHGKSGIAAGYDHELI